MPAGDFVTYDASEEEQPIQEKEELVRVLVVK